MSMLRHKPTGDLYIYTSILAARTDMELIDDAPKAVAEKPAPAKRAPRSSKPKAKVEESKTEKVSTKPDEVVVTDTMEAEIAGLLEGDD